MLIQTTFFCLSVIKTDLFKTSLRLCHPTHSALSQSFKYKWREFSSTLTLPFAILLYRCKMILSILLSLKCVRHFIFYKQTQRKWITWDSSIMACKSINFDISLLNSVVNPCLWQHTMTCFPILRVNVKDCWKQDKAPQTLLCWLREIPLCGEWVSSKDYK